MVRFGFNEPDESGDYPALPSQQKSVALEHAVSVPQLKIPGSFVFDVADTKNDQAPNFRSIHNTGEASKNDFVREHEAIPASYHDHASTDCAMSDVSELERQASPEIVEDYHEPLNDEADDHASTVLDAAFADDLPSSWPMQIQNSRRRYKLLQTPKSGASHYNQRRKGGCLMPTLQYTAHDLDADLFSRGPFSQASWTVTEHTRRTCPLPRPFAFNWSRESILSNSSSIVHVRRLPDGRTHPSENKLNVQCLECIMEHTRIGVDAEQVPSASISPEFQARIIVSNLMSQPERSIWHLASALFDIFKAENANDMDFGRNEAVTDSRRCDLVSAWLKTAISNSVRYDEQRAQSKSELMYIKMSGHQIAEACAVANAIGDYHLATILPLAGGDENTRADIQKQVELWHDRQEHDHIEEYHLKLYRLIAGAPELNIESDTGSASRVYADWKRLFGIYLWYKTQRGLRLADKISKFLEADHYRALQESDQTLDDDVHLYLLDTYVSPDQERRTILRSATAKNQSSSSMLWCLQLYLFECISSSQKRSVSVLNKLEFDQYTLSLSSQLECNGHWKWSIFVLLHIHDPFVREAMIKIVLSRVEYPFSTSEEQFLLNKLKVPRKWLIEALALALRNSQSHEQEVECLLDAGLWNEAHSTLIRHIAPQSIISGRLDHALSLLTRLSKIKNVRHWDHGGQLYKDAMDLMVAAQAHTNSDLHEKTSKGFEAQISRVWGLLKLMFQETFEQRVAKHEIASVLLALAPTSKVDSNDEANRLLSNCQSVRSHVLVQFQTYQH